jgi:hypothetical protein
MIVKGTKLYEQETRWSSRQRLKNRQLSDLWGKFLSRIPWEYFATLTFDPSRVFPVDRELADIEAFWWCGFVGHVLRRPLGWAYAAERGTNGQWHAHALIVGAGVSQLDVASDAWRARNGIVDIQSVHDSSGIAFYASKSVAVDGEVVLSDTLSRYVSSLKAGVVVPLYK